RAIAISGNQEVPMDRHAIDESALQAGHGDVAHKGESAPRLNLKGSDRVRTGEAGVEILGGHRQSDAVGGPAVVCGPGGAAAHFQRADVDPNDAAGRRVGSVDALCAPIVEHGHPVCPEESASNAKPAGQHLLFEGEPTARAHSVKSYAV